jgi:hypothetical protein
VINLHNKVINLHNMVINLHNMVIKRPLSAPDVAFAAGQDMQHYKRNTRTAPKRYSFWSIFAIFMFMACVSTRTWVCWEGGAQRVGKVEHNALGRWSTTRWEGGAQRAGKRWERGAQRWEGGAQRADGVVLGLR